MKIRNGFVSNSSSSSFICNVCGEEHSGWDISLNDADMYECENGHVFCRSHALPYDSKEIALKILEKSIQKYEGKSYCQSYIDAKKCIDDGADVDKIQEILIDVLEFNYNVNESICPICTFKNIKDDDLSKYLLKKLETNKEMILEEIKTKYSSYKEFIKDIKNC